MKVTKNKDEKQFSLKAIEVNRKIISTKTKKKIVWNFSTIPNGILFIRSYIS